MEGLLVRGVFIHPKEDNDSEAEKGQILVLGTVQIAVFSDTRRTTMVWLKSHHLLFAS